MTDDNIILKKVNALDLEPIVYSLVEKSDGPNWEINRALFAEKMYRRFLYVNAVCSSQILVPNEDVDLFWHHHMLDSYKYFEDCNFLFGYYLHHFPYLGTRGEADKRALANLYKESNKIHEELFGEYCNLMNASVCGGSGGGGGGRCGGRIIPGPPPDQLSSRPKVSVKYIPQIA